ncbi:MAG: retroviral-like aspartic protease family protein [Phycisphaeraceae bacterium]|nr:retroviral-like aspartic protease family protein [Phycisphaeraceae bacterium]
MSRTRGILFKARTAFLLSAACVAGQAQAIEIILGPADTLALDQPRITFGITDESTSPGTVIGPGIFNSALLDTGANGILLASPSYRDSGGALTIDYGSVSADLDGSGVIEADEMDLQYAELGVAGTSPLDLHESHGLRIYDSDGVERLIGTDIRTFGDSSLNIGSFAAIVGMPAMQGYAVEIDMRPNLNLGFQRVAFHDTVAQAALESPSTMNVDLRIIEPEFTDSTLADAGFPELLPTFAGLPVIDHVDMRHTGGANSGGATLTADDYTFLVDTGAQTVIISEQMAADMGIDFTKTIAQNGDIVDFLEVGGIGGTVAMPLVTVDDFIMPTQNGPDLVWTDLLVGVLDIDGAPFDAVFGHSMLTTGYLAAAFGGGSGPTTVVNTTASQDPDLIRDLIEGDFIMTVEELVEAAFNISQEDYELLVESQIFPETDDPLVAFNAALALDDELSIDPGIGSPLFDKVVFDFTPDDGTAVMRLDFNESVVIPEPGSLLLLTLAGAAVLSRRRR